MLLLLVISFQIAAQDLIYKKNGEVLKAKILDKTNRSCSYQQYGQSDSVKYFISLTIVDSIQYQDGKRKFINKEPVKPFSHAMKLNELQEGNKTTAII